VTLKVKVVTQIYLDANISKTIRDRGWVPKDYQLEMARGELNVHMTDDVV